MPTKLNDCGCCEGISAIVPGQAANRPGLSQARYRVGTRSIFWAARSPLFPIWSPARCAT